MYKIHPADKSTSLNLKQAKFYRLPRWLVNTEWEGKTSKYLLLRDGFVESPLKEHKAPKLGQKIMVNWWFGIRTGVIPK